MFSNEPIIRENDFAFAAKLEVNSEMLQISVFFFFFFSFAKAKPRFTPLLFSEMDETRRRGIRRSLNLGCGLNAPPVVNTVKMILGDAQGND